MRFKRKHKGFPKSEEIHHAEQNLFQFFQIEGFTIISNPIANSKEITKTLKIAKLSAFIEKEGTIQLRA